MRPKITIDRSKFYSDDYFPDEFGHCCYLGLFIIERDFNGNFSKVDEDIFTKILWEDFSDKFRMDITDAADNNDETKAKELFYFYTDYEVEFIGEYPK
jgi:hypothetical protein